MGAIYGLDCDLAYGDNDEHRCVWCGTELTGRQQRWCSVECPKAFVENHCWTNARTAALRRHAWSCVQCTLLPALHLPERREFGWDERTFDFAVKTFREEVERRRLEVHHVEARAGRGYARGCHHHQSGLTVLCHEHHVGETRVQRAERTGHAVSEQRQLQLAS